MQDPMLDPTVSDPSSDPSSESDRYSLPLGQLVVSDDQPRKHFNPLKLQELTDSIKTHGILEPLIVRPIDDNLYELVAGERRYRAAQAAGLDEVPVVIRALTREEALQLALVENLQREDLNVVEETESIILLLSLRLDCTPEEVPSLLHRLARSSDNVVGSHEEFALKQIQQVFQAIGTISWTSFASHRLPLLNLPYEIREALRAGQIAYTKARAIAKLKEPKVQKQLLDDTIKTDLSLRDIQARIDALEPNTPPAAAPKPLPSLEQRCARLSRQLRRKKAWSNDQKRKRVEKLIAELETLLSAEETE
jgi:ParB family chromosome partitioning protein